MGHIFMNPLQTRLCHQLTYRNRDQAWIYNNKMKDNASFTNGLLFREKNSPIIEHLHGKQSVIYNKVMICNS